MDKSAKIDRTFKISKYATSKIVFKKNKFYFNGSRPIVLKFAEMRKLCDRLPSFFEAAKTVENGTHDFFEQQRRRRQKYGKRDEYENAGHRFPNRQWKKTTISKSDHNETRLILNSSYNSTIVWLKMYLNPALEQTPEEELEVADSEQQYSDAFPETTETLTCLEQMDEPGDVIQKKKKKKRSENPRMLPLEVVCLDDLDVVKLLEFVNAMQSIKKPKLK